MMFPVIGSIYQSMKTAELKMKWQQRKNNPNMRDEKEDPLITRLRRDAENVRKSNILSSISGKLKAGGELTDEELAYLKNNNPAMYQEAIEIKKEREQYKKELENCKTKEDVEKVHMTKMQNFLMEAQTVENNANIPKGEKYKLMGKIYMRLMGVESEHIRFTKTAQYANLPSEKELREEEEKAEERQMEKDAEAEERPREENDGPRDIAQEERFTSPAEETKAKLERILAPVKESGTVVRAEHAKQPDSAQSRAPDADPADGGKRGRPGAKLRKRA